MNIGREINEIYIFELLKNFGMSLVGIFIPIYILSEGFSIYHAGLFVAISGFAGLFLSYPVALLVARKGFKHGLAASYLLVVPALAAIRMLELSVSLIVISGLMYHVGRAMHSICLNSEFAVDSRSKTRDMDSSMMLSLPNISRFLAPLLGGIIFASLGFKLLLMVSIFFLLLSVIPLMMTEDHRDPMEYDFRDFLDQDILDVIPVFVTRGIDAVTSVTMFGIFVYTVVGGTVDVGSARALDSLGFAATGLITGKFIQRYGEKIPLLIGAGGNAIIQLLRGFVSTPVQAFSVSVLGGIMFQIYHVPLYSRFARLAEDSDVLEFYTLRKMFVGLGNLLVVSTLLSFTYIYGINSGLKATFLLASFSMMLIARWA